MSITVRASVPAIIKSRHYPKRRKRRGAKRGRKRARG